MFVDCRYERHRLLCGLRPVSHCWIRSGHRPCLNGKSLGGRWCHRDVGNFADITLASGFGELDLVELLRIVERLLLSSHRISHLAFVLQSELDEHAARTLGLALRFVGSRCFHRYSGICRVASEKEMYAAGGPRLTSRRSRIS